MTRESLRLEQADKILKAIESALRSGYEVRFRPSVTGGTTVEVGAAGGHSSISIVRHECRDAAAHALQIVLSDLAAAALERAELRERLDSDEEPLLSPERGVRAHDYRAPEAP